MTNVRGTFMECLKAVEAELHERQPQVQENVRVFELGGEFEPGQGIQARLTAGSILGVVGEIMTKKQQETSVQGLEEDQKKIGELEEKLVQLQTELNEEKQMRLGHEEKLIDMKEELNKEKNLGIVKDNKLKKLEEELKKEKDLKLIQAEMLIEKQRQVNVEKESRITAEDKLSKREIELNEAKDLITNLEETVVKNETKLKMERIETEKLLKRTEEELTREKQLRFTENNKMQEELNKEKSLRTSEKNKLEDKLNIEKERCAELSRKLEELQKAAAQQIETQLTAAEQKQYGGGAQQKKPKLTSEEHKKYGEQLHDACRTGDVSKVRQNLSLGVDCDVGDWINWTPLHLAALHGHTDVCRVLLDAAARVSPRDITNNSTPLHWAAGAGHLAVVRLLVERGADHGLRDCLGYTPLDYAVRYNEKQVADYLRHLQ